MLTKTTTMRTKNIIVVFFIILSFASCKKADKIIIDDILLVGVKSENVNYYNSNCNIGDITMDLNNDSKFDIKLWTNTFGSPNGHLYSSGLRLLDSSFQIAITLDSISPKIYNFNDTINKITRWSDFSQKNSFILVEESDNGLYPQYSYNYTYWLNKVGYICIRKEYEDGKYKYGWIKIEVDNSYYSYKLLEYAFMK